jgi:hypothetical protein
MGSEGAQQIWEVREAAPRGGGLYIVILACEARHESVNDAAQHV